MNLDIFTQINYADDQGLRVFMLAHKFAHDQIASAIQRKFGVSLAVAAVESQAAEEAWIALMKPPKKPTPQALTDWLQLHGALHDTEYQLIFPSVSETLDLSFVDFSVPGQFYDWMYAHQAIHDNEATSLNLT